MPKADDRFALPLTVERCRLGGLAKRVSSRFERHTTVVHLEGLGEEGVGEDVTYHAGDQLEFQREFAGAAVRGAGTLEDFLARLDTFDLFPAAPDHEDSRRYRRWAFESAALDLALRQAGLSFAGWLGREPRPVRFVVSLRLGQPPVIEPVRRLLAIVPDLKLKLDATSDWSVSLIERLAATGAVSAIDFKGAYHGTIVDQPPDPELYRRIALAFPQAWLEDPAWTPQTRAALGDAIDRVTWDAPLHTLADIEALERRPRSLNVKPSRFATLGELFAVYDHCATTGIAPYGGGQFELGPGRGQIQYLASLFHAEAGNDVAPASYNEVEPKAPLPTSPLPPSAAARGFRWGAESWREVERIA